MRRFRSTEPGRPKWVPHLDTAASSKHQGIFDALVSDIANGRLGPGDRLPPQRFVANALGVDLTTVTKAYNRARAEGLIEATIGRGSFVSAGGAPGASQPSEAAALLDLGRNSPPRPASADLRKALVKEIARASSGSDDRAQFDYQDIGGNWANRSAGAVWLGRRMASPDPERVVLTSGAQTALFALCHLLCRTSKRIAAGQFSYPGIHTVAFQQGLQLVPLAMDAQGIVPASFEDACQREAPAAIYVTPTIDNPTTATLPESRRQEIAALARKYAVAILEDDPYSELLEAPPASLASIAPDLTWHVATLSKCVTPAFRLGYVAAPSVEAAQQLAAVLQAMTMMTSPLTAALASRWIYSGFIKEVSAAIRDENMARQELAARILSGETLAADPSGPHTWLSLPSPWRAIDFVHQAERMGVILVAGSSFAPTSPTNEAVRISLGAAPDRKTLERALTLVRTILTASQPNAMRAMV